jgi:polar amino acid transport system substrate-binding protein
MARDLSAIKSSGTLKVAVDGQTPGFNFYKGKELTGFEVELAAEMARGMALKVEWTVQPFNTLLVGLSQDRFDLIATSHAITPDRQKVADFAAPHYCTGAMIISRPGGPKTLAELKGKTVAVPVGTVYFDYLKKQPGIKQVKTLPSETGGLQDLLGGKSDAWVTEEFVAYQAIQAHPQLQSGERLFPQKNAMVIGKGNSALLGEWNAQLKKVFEDGTYARLSKKYFQRDIRCP